MARNIPEFCDFVCPHAGFPPAETAGLCRTMSAVWCRKLRTLVNKNARCAWRRQRPDRRRPKRGQRPGRGRAASGR